MTDKTVPIKEKNPKIAKDVAEKEFLRWAEYIDLDMDTSEMDVEDKTDFNKLKGRIVRAILSGKLTVSEDGAEITHQLILGKDTELTYAMPKGSGLLQMDQHKSTQMVGKTYAYMGAMSGRPHGYFANMDGRDVKIAIAVATLFMD